MVDWSVVADQFNKKFGCDRSGKYNNTTYSTGMEISRIIVLSPHEVIHCIYHKSEFI